ncbi:hypothetical protein ACWIG4_30230 [Streptomyces sp. NPDC002248]
MTEIEIPGRKFQLHRNPDTKFWEIVWMTPVNGQFGQFMPHTHPMYELEDFQTALVVLRYLVFRNQRRWPYEARRMRPGYVATVLLSHPGTDLPENLFDGVNQARVEKTLYTIMEAGN